MRATIVALRNKTLESNNNQEKTPASPRPPRSPLRPPLQYRDRNAMVRNAPLTAKSGNAADNMPLYDKQNRPPMPALSVSTAKTTKRTPLTPRVAGSAPQAASTPLSRRGARLDNNHTPPVGPSREDLSTQVSTFLSNNVTPRSGSRKSRVDSTHTTPSGTPNGTPASSSIESFRAASDVPTYGSGLGMVGSDKDVPKRPMVSFSPAVSDLGHAKSPVPSTADSKFFFASDAKSIHAHPKPQPQPKTASTFFYANGDSIPPLPQSSSTSAVGSVAGEERSQPKFFHANDTIDLHASPSSHFPPPRPSSTVSTNGRITSPRLATASPGTLSPQQRPSSPQKLNQHASITSLRSAPSLPSTLLARPPPQGRGQSANGIVASRKANIENGKRVFSHGRSASVDSPESKSARRTSSSSSFDSLAPITQLSIATTSLPASTPEEVTEDTNHTFDDIPSGLQSPIKTGHSIEHMNELAANARRERKVLDLEITNSSLAAINRTLEREMRKQTAELRRYRRLSRSGRLSIATSASMRTASGSLSIMEGGEGTQLSDMSEEEKETESEFDSSESESLDEGSLSPSAMAESDLRHRKRDEKRLQLDLSKHQQLLIDSQKMNQSLKRCLGWTEELITEGRKALEYHVRVSDVELGGRVLAPDEMDEDQDGLGEIAAPTLKEATLACAIETAPWTETVEGAGGKDGGIKLDTDAQRERLEGILELIPLPEQL